MVGSDDLKKPSGTAAQKKGAACPLGKNVLATVLAVGRDDAKTAAKTILDTNALPSICGRVPPSARRTKLAISMTSNQTYRLNMSAVTKEPHTPASIRWRNGK